MRSLSEVEIQYVAGGYDEPPMEEGGDSGMGGDGGGKPAEKKGDEKKPHKPSRKQRIQQFIVEQGIQLTFGYVVEKTSDKAHELYEKFERWLAEKESQKQSEDEKKGTEPGQDKGPGGADDQPGSEGEPGSEGDQSGGEDKSDDRSDDSEDNVKG